MNTPNSQVTEQDYLRDLVRRWRKWADAMRFVRQANRVRECADDLEKAIAALTARTEAANTIHSCSYYCDRPDCVKAQRDELREAYVARQSDRVVLVPMEPTAHMIESATGGSDFRTADCETLGDERALLRRQWAAMLSARPQPAQGDGWLPIESAPRDGSCVLLADSDSVTPGFYHDGSECYGHRGKAGFFDESDRGNLLTASNLAATHWRPLPPPPAPADGGGK